MFGSIPTKEDFCLYLYKVKDMAGICWSSIVLTCTYIAVSYCEIETGIGEWSMENNENAHFE